MSSPFLVDSSKPAVDHNNTGSNASSSFSAAPESLASLDVTCPDFLLGEVPNGIPSEILNLNPLIPHGSTTFAPSELVTNSHSNSGCTSPSSSQDQDQDQEYTSLSSFSSSSSVTPDRQQELQQQQQQHQLRCWDHGCNGRLFSSKSNLMRHRKERSSSAAGNASNRAICPLCGAIFTRNSARDTHLAKQSCARIRRYSNGRMRPSRLAMLGNPQLAAASGYGNCAIAGAAEEGNWGDFGSMGWS